MKIILFIFITSLLSSSSGAISLQLITELFKLIYHSTRGSWTLLEMFQQHPLTSVQIENKLLVKLTKVSENIDIIVDRLDMVESDTLNKLNDIQSEMRYEIQLNSLIDNIADIEASYTLFKSYTNQSLNGTVEKYTMKNFAEQTVSHSENSVYSKFLKINILILGKESGQLITREGFFDVMSTYLATKSSQCYTTQSPTQLLTNMFILLQVTQYKAFLMIQYSWMLLRLYNKGDFIKEANILKSIFVEQIEDQTEALLKSLSGAKNSFWRCDPQIHVKEKTYTQVTNFLQGYIVNEVDINPGGTCWQNCAYYINTKQYDCYKNLFCATQPKCNGTIFGCRYHYKDMWVCHSPPNTNRLYDYIQFDGDDIYGKETSCTSSSKASSWWRWLFWHCSYCYCYCDDHTNSDRFFNLRPVVSDVLNNRIITGLRFIKVNKIIHLQIQEGQVIDEANVNMSTISWRPVDSYNIADPSVKPDSDYHTLNWEHRAIHLDDLIVPKNYLVTGVKFRRLGGKLNLEIQASLFNRKSGKLINPLNNSFWISSYRTEGNLRQHPTEVKLIRPNIPIRSNTDSIIDSSNGQFIKFQSSDDIFDAAQTAVPFIDVQEVTPDPPVPLVGIGLHHKGGKYSGGFIAPKVFTFKYEENLKEFKEQLFFVADN